MAEPRYQPPPRQRPSTVRRRRQEAIPDLPPGFQLEEPEAVPQAPDIPPLPPGFELESGEPQTKRKTKDPSFYDSIVSPALDFAGKAATATRDFVVGKEDPRFGKLSSIDEIETAKDAGLNLGGIGRAKMAGATDKAYLGIIKKKLGNRFAAAEKDANGFDVITYLDGKGKAKKAYLNKPGIDWQDIDRGITSALPYMAAGSAVGAVTKGAPLVAQALAQAAGQGATSVGQDLAAGTMGSEAGIDPVKAGVSAAGGVVGTYAAPALKALFGGKAKVNPKWVGPDGKPTPQAQRHWARKYPDMDQTALGQKGMRDFGRAASQAADPDEALFQSQAGSFNIPTTKYQRTRNVAQGLTEKDIRYGRFGDVARRSLEDFDMLQKQRIHDAALGTRFAPPVPQTANSAPMPTTDGFAKTFAPHRSYGQQHPADLGEGIQSGLQAAKDKLKGWEQQAWDRTRNMAPRSGATDGIGDFVSKALDGGIVNADLHPASAAMSRAILAFQNGKTIPNDIAELTGRQAVTYVDEMRRVLGKMVGDAAPGSRDKTLAGKMYQGFNDWIDDAATRNLLTGRPQDAKNLRNAIDMTKQIKGMLEPVARDGKKTAAARVLKSIEDATTGAEVLNSLLGTSGSKAAFKQGGVAALKNYKDVVTQYGGELGKQAWDDVRMAYWLKNVTDKGGNILTPGRLRTSLKDALSNQREVMQALYSKDEIRAIRKFAEAVSVVAAPDVNASGSGAAIRAMTPLSAGTKAASGMISAQAGRESLVHGNIWRARVMRFIATYIKQFDRPAGSGVARHATSQSLTPRRSPNFGGIGGGVGAQISNSRGE